MTDIQPLDKRQKHREMSDEDKALHTRCLYVDPEKTMNRAIVWADDVERRARWEKKGFVVAEEIYIEPRRSGKKKDIVVVRVPLKSATIAGQEGL